MSWTTVPLRDVVRDVRSGFASGKDIPDGVLQFRMNNITTEGAIDLTKKRRVPSPQGGVDAFLLQPGDVLFNATNSPELVGKSAYFPGLDEPVTFSNHFLRLRPGGAEGRYLARWLTYEFSIGAFQSITRRWVNQAAIDKDALLDREIPLPTLTEQRRIADILDQADALRSARRSSIASLSELVIAAFGAHFSRAELAERVPLARAFAISPNYGTMIPPAETGDFRSLRVKNIQNASLDLSDAKYVDLPPKDWPRHSVEDGDLLMARAIGSLEHLGKCIVAYPGDARWAFDSHLMRIRLDREVMLPEYLRVWLLTPGGRAAFLRIARRSAVQHNVNTKEIAAFPVPISAFAISG